MIQDNQPLFILVWVGSAVVLACCTVLGFVRLEGVDLGILLVASATYLFGVQASTVLVHLPLNNALQSQQTERLDAAQLSAVRAGFEPRWNRSNRIRTALACFTSLALIVLVFRL